MNNSNNDQQLEALVETVRASSKYADISVDLVRSIAAQELAKRASMKEAVKATRSKLHQVGGAYLSGKEAYDRWRDELREALQSGNREALLATCRRIMSHHASTRERLPILDQFYSTLIASLPPVASILDVACGLNPLALPWLPPASLAPDTTYLACDIYSDMTGFLNEFFTLIHEQGYDIEGHAETRDILTACPVQPVDVALILKTIPCLEQVDKSTGHRLLRALNAKYLVVSFPIHSLGGKSKGMLSNYENHFRDLVSGEPWEIERFEFATELVFLVRK